MIKVEVEVSGVQEERLRSLAQERGVSVEEAIRLCVDETLSGPPQDRKALYDRAARVIGAFEDVEGATDLSIEHDRYLSEP
jgi:hypothetical protein